MTAATTAAVILSAGISSRMGKFKPLLPLGNKTVVEQVVTTVFTAGIRDIQVILGHRARDVMAVLEKTAVSCRFNDAYLSEMITSVKMGIAGLKSDSEACFILPVDIPLVRSQTLQLLMEVFSSDTSKIIYPTFLGERGHPPLIPRQYADALSLWEGGGGLKGFLAQYDRRSLDVPVFDRGTLLDMDTREQYRRIVARYENIEIPLRRECDAMMAARFSKNHPVVRHSRVVAGVARDIGEKLLRAGWSLNLDLIEACGYLHDIGKGEKKHARFGARLLKKMGYPNIADIIESHMALPFEDEWNITEKEVLFLADKLVYGENILPLDRRLRIKLKQLSGRPEGNVAAKERIRTAMKIEKAIEGITGGTFSLNETGSRATRR
jgi:putative nucleotidyltransferase with HDIG domain